MNILLVYPKYPETFWSFKHALKFISKKAAYPPLGLLTVASMLPDEWNLKLIDMNVKSLKNKDIQWADYVFLSAMDVQRDSVNEVIERCKSNNTKVVAGGPLFTTAYEEFKGVDYFVLNEAEATLKPFLNDLKEGNPKPVYTSHEYPTITETPVPAWELINMKDYSTMSIQYSRGCPYDCEFCDIVLLNGRIPRTKSSEQVIAELDALYKKGWRGSVFLVDDNFIGNKHKLKNDILPKVIKWVKERNEPFSFITEVSIDLTDDEQLMEQMSEAGFTSLFVGIETTNEESLIECGKMQNQNRDILSSVKTLQSYGFQVFGGFIVGFDHDTPSIFDNLIDFIQNSGIVTAMVGILTAPPGTKLYNRLKKENRLLSKFSGNNTTMSTNFIPKMNYDTLIDGYKKIVKTIYSPKNFYKRAKTFLKNYNPKVPKGLSLKFEHFVALIKSMWILGIKEKGGRKDYWKFIFWTLFKRPRLFPLSVELSIYGLHFRKSFGSI
jgi:radical SAM superfamily enzyme YgiQ (UPF0313 family)